MRPPVVSTFLSRAPSRPLRHALAALLFVAFGSAGALAAKPQPKHEAAPSIPLPSASAFKDGDRAQLKAALDEARMAGPAASALALAIGDRLKSGLDPELTVTAIETLGDIGSDHAGEAVAWYARHRRPAVRRAAVNALAKTRGATAKAVLVQSLGDPDAQVRAAAAVGLGAMKAKDAVAELFVALDHKVNEAAVSIGQLCAAPDCEKLAEKLGQLPFDVVTSGLDPVLFRPASEINDDAKIKVIGRLRELGTMEANRFLRDVAKKWPADGSKRVKQSIDQAVLATMGSAGAPGGGAQ